MCVWGGMYVCVCAGIQTCVNEFMNAVVFDFRLNLNLNIGLKSRNLMGIAWLKL